MDSRVNRLNKELRSYDRDLYIERDSFGAMHLYRKARRYKVFEYEGCPYAASYDQKQFIMSLTSDWQPGSKPVNWGIEPLMRRINEIDSWRDDTGLDEFQKRRELGEKWKKESHKQELRATAADMRKDFAKATNDIVIRAGAHNKTIF